MRPTALILAGLVLASRAAAGDQPAAAAAGRTAGNPAADAPAAQAAARDHLVAARQAAVAPASPGSSSAILYLSQTIADNALGFALTNYGYLGNNFTVRSASLEYPLGAGYEHLVGAGLWIGANVAESGAARVTNGFVSPIAGHVMTGYSEFTPTGDHIDHAIPIVGASLRVPDNMYVADFDDQTIRPIEQIEVHVPLGVSVRQRVFTWTDASYENFALLRYGIRNVGANHLTNVWVGIASELSSGNKAASPGWPPAGWFNKSWLQYDADLRLLREHYCLAQPVPVNCNMAAVPPWVGVQVLTPPSGLPGGAVTVAGWAWRGVDDLTMLPDASKYAGMSAGTITDLSAPWLMPMTGDPEELIAIGPFASLAPGDSITVDFSLVGGADEAAIRANAALAQTARDEMLDITTAVGDPGPAPGVALAIRGVFPNPSGPLAGTLRFSLAAAGEVTVACYDLLGRREGLAQLGGLSPGEHALPLARFGALAPGLHLLRVTQGAHAASARALVVR